MAIGGGLSWILPISLCANTALNPFGHHAEGEGTTGSQEEA